MGRILFTYKKVTPEPETPCFGYLYNWYAVDDTRELTSSVNWSVPQASDFTTLISYIGGNSYGRTLQETGTIYWDKGNGTNIYNFNARGSGRRTGDSGVFNELKERCNLWTSTEYDVNNASIGAIDDLFGTITVGTVINKDYGFSVRLISDATGLPDGATTTYTGNDGKTYNAVCINELYWTTENLEETQYRNGDIIPNITDNSTWAGLSSGALCLYENNVSYACKAGVPSEFSLVLFVTVSGSVMDVYQYDYLTKNVTYKFSSPTLSYPTNDIAHSLNKIWINNGIDGFEYDLTLSPFNAVYNKTIVVKDSAGLGAIDDTTIVAVDDATDGVYEINPVTGVNTYKFNIESGAVLVGDFYVTTTNKFIITYRLGSRYWIAQYNYLTGALELKIETPSHTGIRGLFQYEGEMFLCNNSAVYHIEKSPPYTITLYDSIGFTINGASQLPAYLTSHFTT